MDWLIATAMTGVAVAIATTFDDNIYLTVFFGRVNRTFRPHHIIIGEYVGFTVLVGLSLVGFLGGLVISPMWVGLLGLLPVWIGLRGLLNREDESGTVQTVSETIGSRARTKQRQKSLLATLRDPQTYRVSAVTIANGGNNIGIYVPLFASSTLPKLSIIVLVCYSAIGLWCFLSYNLTRQPNIAFFLARCARRIFPFILIWLGLSIVIENESYRLFVSL